MGNTKSKPKEKVVPESQESNPNKENKIKKSGNGTKKSYRSTVESTHDCSSWNGGVDPTDLFRQTIQAQANLGKLPPICMQHRCQFYIWKSGTFGLGHDSIVVGTAEEEYKGRYGYFTIELRVDDGSKDGDVIPYTQFLSREDGGNRKGKWEKAFTLDTTIDQLINFAIELIKHHGTYSSFHNGCQQFVYDFCDKITSVENDVTYQEALKNDKTYQKHLENPCWYSSAAKGYRKCRVNSKTKYMGHGYQTAEETAIGIGTLLVLPYVGIAISKGANDDNQRHTVKWKHGGNVNIEEQIGSHNSIKEEST